jgi:hypothetical protein
MTTKVTVMAHKAAKAATEREDIVNTPDPRQDPRLNDTTFIGTEEGQALMAAAAQADKDARKEAAKITRKATAAANAAKDAEAEAARQPGPVVIVKPPANGKPTAAARKAGVTAFDAALDAIDAASPGDAIIAMADAALAKPARKRPAKPTSVPEGAPVLAKASRTDVAAAAKLTVEKQLAAILARVLELRAAGKDHGKHFPIYNRDGSLAAHQSSSYAWKCPTCQTRLRTLHCVGAKATAHKPVYAPAGFRVEDRIV